MLKGIVTLFKTLVVTRPKSYSSFSQRFIASNAHTDQYQWNGGRHLSLKEMKAADFNNTLGIKAEDRHVS